MASTWAERAAERSPSVQRSRTRSLERAQQIVAAARRLVAVKGADFTTHELVKEAGIAVQTFYKYFGGKDQVLLAVIEDLISERCSLLREQARPLPDPVSRLRHYVLGVVDTAGSPGPVAPGAQFIATEHWRLQQLHPQELAAATKVFSDLLLEELQAAAGAGLLAPANPDYDAWLANQLIVAVFHHYAFARTDESMTEIGERVWSFCLGAWGGRVEASAPRRRTLRRSVGG